jgi:hypothetical protein
MYFFHILYLHIFLELSDEQRFLMFVKEKSTRFNFVSNSLKYTKHAIASIIFIITFFSSANINLSLARFSDSSKSSIASIHKNNSMLI